MRMQIWHHQPTLLIPFCCSIKTWSIYPPKSLSKSELGLFLPQTIILPWSIPHPTTALQKAPCRDQYLSSIYVGRTSQCQWCITCNKRSEKLMIIEYDNGTDGDWWWWCVYIMQSRGYGVFILNIWNNDQTKIKVKLIRGRCKKSHFVLLCQTT